MSYDEISEKLSRFIWDWMKVTDVIPHGKAREEGITSFIMYNLFKETDPFLKLFFEDTGFHEKISGADFYFVLVDRYMNFKLILVQAKKLGSAKKQNFILNKYRHFNHDVGNLKQFDIFLEYAAFIDAEPYYLFYNSEFNQPKPTPLISEFPNIMSVDVNYNISDEVFGTLFTDALVIKDELFGGSSTNLRNPSFKEIMKLEPTVTLQQYFRNFLSTGGTGGSTGGTGGSTGGTGGSTGGTGGSTGGTGGSTGGTGGSTGGTGGSTGGTGGSTGGAGGSTDKQTLIKNNRKTESQMFKIVEENQRIKKLEIIPEKKNNEEHLREKSEKNEKNKKSEKSGKIELIPVKLEELSDSSIKLLEKFDSKTKKKLLEIIEKNYDRLPIVVFEYSEQSTMNYAKEKKNNKD